MLTPMLTIERHALHLSLVSGTFRDSCIAGTSTWLCTTSATSRRTLRRGRPPRMARTRVWPATRRTFASTSPRCGATPPPPFPYPVLWKMLLSQHHHQVRSHAWPTATCVGRIISAVPVTVMGMILIIINVDNPHPCAAAGRSTTAAATGSARATARACATRGSRGMTAQGRYNPHPKDPKDLTSVSRSTSKAACTSTCTSTCGTRNKGGSAEFDDISARP